MKNKMVKQNTKVIQKTMEQFLSPSSKRTTSTRSKEDKAETPSPKRLKSEENGSNEPTQEQKERMDRNKWQAKIKLQAKTTPALCDNIGQSWFEALLPEFQKASFAKLSEFLVSERKNGTIYPPEEDVWSWTHHTKISEIKVVLLGQDPYHGPKQAHGLAFSVQKGISAPPSLVNMYKELKNSIEGFNIPDHGNLTGWAKQGVLLLNACLTVRAHQANSHKDRGWESVTDAVIKRISDQNKGVVFLLWGGFAQKKASLINKTKHHILKAPHPSPLSAHRGFLGSQHFSKTNEILKSEGKKEIDWTDLYC